jgi:hypothetical protein
MSRAGAVIRPIDGDQFNEIAVERATLSPEPGARKVLRLSDSTPMFDWHSDTVNRFNSAEQNSVAAVWAGAICRRAPRPDRRRLSVREMFRVEHLALLLGCSTPAS